MKTNNPRVFNVIAHTCRTARRIYPTWPTGVFGPAHWLKAGHRRDTRMSRLQQRKLHAYAGTAGSYRGIETRRTA